MKISIITPTYNSAQHLQHCIDSIQAQSFSNIEHIIIDGGSTDGTLDIIRKNEQNITAWISESDRGMYDAINKGLKMATGDVVGILNSDDFYATRDALAIIAKTFSENDTDAVYADLNIVLKNDTAKVYRSWVSSPYKRSKFYWGWMPPHPTFYHKRNLLEKFGYYENHYYTAADYEFMCRYLFKNHVSAVYIPYLLINMRAGGMSNGSIKKRLRANRRDYLAMKKNGIPFPLIVSWYKPISELKQYRVNMPGRPNPLKGKKAEVSFQIP